MRNLKKFDIEFKLKHKKKHLCAMDETGRGSMASIFVAACVIMPDDFFDEKINDSKKLSESSIISLSEKIKNHAIFYDVVSYSHEEIDQTGIQNINIKAFEQLKNHVEGKFDSLFIADGNIMENKKGFFSLVKGDSISFSIACASIIAKEYRDSYLKLISENYEQWNLNKNKGYGQDYIERCKQFGYPDVHRKSYKIKNEKQINFY